MPPKKNGGRGGDTVAEQKPKKKSPAKSKTSAPVSGAVSEPVAEAEATLNAENRFRKDGDTPAGNHVPGGVEMPRELEDSPISEEDIRRRAYEIYQRRGGHHGLDQNDWFQAEQELRQERRRSA